MHPTLEVILDNPSGIYFPGQAVSGRVRLTVFNPVACYVVSVKFKGFGHVSWTEEENTGSGSERRKETVRYCSNEEYYFMEYKLYGVDNIPVTLYSGKTDYNFTFQLPPNIPSSYESKIGHIRHLCTAKLSLVRGKPLYCTKPISVNSICDLNLHPNAKIPIVKEDSKQLCCLCCTSGNISLHLNINRSGYVPGENIIVNAECTNDSSRALKKSSIKLIQNVKYNAQGKSKCENNTICKIEHPETLPGEDDAWINVPFNVPPLPSSDIQHCKLIETSYSLEFSMVPKGPSFALTIKAPIYIGTVPLQQTFSSFTPYNQPAMTDMPPPYAAHNFPPMQGTPPQPPVPYPSAPSVSYPSAPPAPYPDPPYPVPGPTPPVPQPGGAYGFNFPPMQQYPNMPLPANEDSFFGFTILNNEIDGEPTQENLQWAPRYITYNLTNQNVHQNPGALSTGMNTMNHHDTVKLLPK